MRRDQGDIPVLRAITNAVGAALWFNCILVLTHAAAAPPDSSNGPIPYDTYVNQRTHLLQQTIRCGPTTARYPTYSLSSGPIPLMCCTDVEHLQLLGFMRSDLLHPAEAVLDRGLARL